MHRHRSGLDAMKSVPKLLFGIWSPMIKCAQHKQSVYFPSTKLIKFIHSKNWSYFLFVSRKVFPKCYHWLWHWSKQKIAIFLTHCSKTLLFQLEIFSSHSKLLTSLDFHYVKGHPQKNIQDISWHFAKRWVGTCFKT